MPDETVLVSGASGYIALHCVKQLLEAGYKVRGTVRSIKNDEKTKPIREVCPQAKDNLELVEGDLLDDKCWNSAVDGCDYVLHVASPFITDIPKDPDVLIKPAVEGTLNVLKAAASTKGKVKRVVVTSSMAAVCSGYLDQPGKVFTEADWTRTEGGREIKDVTPYIKSKTLAERAAWDFHKDLPADEKFELAVINPGFVLGPLLHTSQGASAEVVKKFMMGEFPIIPKTCMSCVDVRDVAKAHVAAMLVIITPEAAGNRFICVEKEYMFKGIADSLRPEFEPLGYRKIPSREAPNWLLKGYAFFDKSVGAIVPSLGHTFTSDNSKLRSVLKVEPLIPLEKSLVDMGHSLIAKGIVPKSEQYKAPESQ